MTRATKAEAILVAITVLIITILCSFRESDAPMHREIIFVPDSFYRSIIIVDFSVNEEVSIREALAPLFTQQCTAAFTKAGLRSPAEVALREGVVILPSSSLYYYSARSLGLVDERTRTAYQWEFSTARAQAGTVSHVLYGVRRTTDGRARIFLHETAFMGESFIFGWRSLNSVLAHEFIHVGGQPPVSGWFFEDDLGGFEHYDEIMDACTYSGS